MSDFKVITGPQGGRIILDGREMINMAANNYLGLANHPAVVGAAKAALDEYGLGAGAARGIVGNFRPHEELEEKLAAFKGVPAVSIFNSGLTANLGVIPLIIGKSKCKSFIFLIHSKSILVRITADTQGKSVS